MAGGDELVRVARNKKCYILPQNIVPGRYHVYMHLEKNVNTQLHFSRSL